MPSGNVKSLPVTSATATCIGTRPVRQSVLEPMAAAKPVVIRRYAEMTHQNVGAELAGLPDLIAASEDEYVGIAERLLQNPGKRRL